MLYVTTRSNQDAYTVNRCLRENRGADGGFYVPFRHPRFSEQELNVLLNQSFGACTAEVLNRLFGRKFTGFDVDFAIGRHPARLEDLGYRTFLANCWYNPEQTLSGFVRRLSSLVCDDDTVPTGWMEIAVRSALLFELFADLRKLGISTADISCVSGDFVAPISAWYARYWGLPIGRILCCCNENNSIWELLTHGQMHTDAVSIPTSLPFADVTVPTELERLIFAWGGAGEVRRYIYACRNGKTYFPGDSLLDKIRNGLYACVVSSHRIETVIPSVCKTHGVRLSPATALAYSGLLDYRAKTGSTNYALVWSEESPEGIQ